MDERILEPLDQQPETPKTGLNFLELVEPSHKEKQKKVRGRLHYKALMEEN